MSKEYFLSLRTQYENLGDFLIAQATVDLLTQFGNVTLDVRNVPESYLALFDLPKNVLVVKSDFALYALKNRRSWVYVVKPGGYSTSNSLKSRVKNILMALYFRGLKRILDVQLMKMPHSIGGRLWASDVFYNRTFDLLCCRDLLSLENYRKHGVGNAVLAPDMAVYYINQSSMFRTTNSSAAKNSVVISLRYDRLNDEPEISDMISKNFLLEDELSKLVFISQVTFDHDINQSSSIRNDGLIVKYSVDADSLKDIVSCYASAKYVISNRLHSLLLGVINGAIPIALIDTEKDKKIIGCLDVLGIKWLNKKELQNLSSHELNLFGNKISEYSVLDNKDLFIELTSSLTAMN